MSSTPDEVRRLYFEMLRIRRFEERVIELFRRGEFSGFLHSAIGQEGIAVGVAQSLSNDDYVTTTHRGHGHLLARRVPMDRMLAEIYCREEGLCRGMAGHVHMGDLSRRVFGGNGILGENQAIAVGMAFGERLRGKNSVVVTYFGEGAANEGVVHEAMNLASVWSAPVLFLCERNEYAELTPFGTHTKVESLALRAAGYGFEGHTVDGTDVEAVKAVTAEILDDIRRNTRPHLLEARVVRWRGHYEGDPQEYRGAEMEPSADPLAVLSSRWPDVVTEPYREQMKDQVDREVELAVGFARQGTEPQLDDVIARFARAGVTR